MPDRQPSPELVSLLTDKLLELVDQGLQTPIMIIDGRAGSGKSTLAEAVQNKYFKDGESLPRIIHMDDLYPGWNGLTAGAEYLQRVILNPLAKREVAHYQLFDWTLGERKEWREFAGGTPLIIEGCGALNLQSTEVADLRVWLEVEEEIRRQRWIEREGNDDHFNEWAAQELDFYAQNRSAELADLKI